MESLWLYTSNLGMMGDSHFIPPWLKQTSRGSYPFFIWCHIFCTVCQRKLKSVLIPSNRIAEDTLHGCLESWLYGFPGKEQRQNDRKEQNTVTSLPALVLVGFFFCRLTQAAQAKVGFLYALSTSWMPHHASQYHLLLLEEQWSSTFDASFIANLLNNSSKHMQHFSHAQPVPWEHQRTRLSGTEQVL